MPPPAVPPIPRGSALSFPSREAEDWPPYDIDPLVPWDSEPLTPFVTVPPSLADELVPELRPSDQLEPVECDSL